MSFPQVPVDAKGLDWPRKVANAVKQLQNVVAGREAFPFQALAADPATPGEGQTYFNTVSKKVRVWDGTTWTDLW